MLSPGLRPDAAVDNILAQLSSIPFYQRLRPAARRLAAQHAGLVVLGGCDALPRCVRARAIEGRRQHGKRGSAPWPVPSMCALPATPVRPPCIRLHPLPLRHPDERHLLLSVVTGGVALLHGNRGACSSRGGGVTGQRLQEGCPSNGTSQQLGTGTGEGATPPPRRDRSDSEALAAEAKDGVRVSTHRARAAAEVSASTGSTAGDAAALQLQRCSIADAELASPRDRTEHSSCATETTLRVPECLPSLSLPALTSQAAPMHSDSGRTGGSWSVVRATLTARSRFLAVSRDAAAASTQMVASALHCVDQGLVERLEREALAAAGFSLMFAAEGDSFRCMSLATLAMLLHQLWCSDARDRPTPRPAVPNSLQR